MTDPNSPWDAPQNPGPPDSVETDGAALSSAEDLDEDRLHEDPLEKAMDPPEHWTGVTEYGMTAWEQAHPRGLGERIDEEEPDVTERAGRQASSGDNDRPAEAAAVRTGQEESPGDTYEGELGITADGRSE